MGAKDCAPGPDFGLPVGRAPCPVQMSPFVSVVLPLPPDGGAEVEMDCSAIVLENRIFSTEIVVPGLPLGRGARHGPDRRGHGLKPYKNCRVW